MPRHLCSGSGGVGPAWWPSRLIESKVHRCSGRVSAGESVILAATDRLMPNKFVAGSVDQKRVRGNEGTERETRAERGLFTSSDQGSHQARTFSGAPRSPSLTHTSSRRFRMSGRPWCEVRLGTTWTPSEASAHRLSCGYSSENRAVLFPYLKRHVEQFKITKTIYLDTMRRACLVHLTHQLLLPILTRRSS
jgi:hypothetical protein